MHEDESVINEVPGDTEHLLSKLHKRFEWKTALTKIKNAMTTVMATQVLSVITCGTAVFTQILKNWYRFDASISQMFLIYVILGIVFGTILAARDDFLTTIKNNWWKYIIVGAADVEANYLVVLSQKYTTLTSVQLLDSFSLFTVLVLSFLFLRVRYHLIHLIGIFICIVGMACLIVADLDKKQEGYNIPLGDVLCLCGSMLFGISNVTQEFLVKKHTIVEFLALLGISGTIISGIQLSVLERTSLVSVNWNNYRVALLLAGFIVALVLFYILMPVMLRRSSATVVDLSLLTADFYALLCGIVIFKYTFSWLYFAAFCLIIAGLIIYNLKPTSKAKHHFLWCIYSKLRDLKK